MKQILLTATCLLLATLSGSAQTIKASKIEAARARIWGEWKAKQTATTNLNFPTQELTNAWFFTWDLPTDLEPNAQLNYYWGKAGSNVNDNDNDSDSVPAVNGGGKNHKSPLVLYLHGSGPREMEWKTGYKLGHYFSQEVPGYYFVPQIPQEGQWYRWYQRSKQWAYERLLRLALTKDDVDPDQIYMIGISEGGYGSQRLASFYADYLAGAGPMAGGEPLKNAPAENCGNIAFSLLTGVQDKGFYRDELTYWTQQAFDSLQATYPDRFLHRVNLIPGYGHSIPYGLSLKWLKHFRRTAQPRHFLWEDFEMDGRHREGFYNLQVLERSHPEQATSDRGRQMYQMDIEGQTVHLKVDDVAYTTTKTDTIWGIEMRFVRQFTPSTKGKLRLYLSEELVDLTKPVKVIVNGRETYCGKLKFDERWLRESLQLFGDPRRLFPAAIEVDLAQK